MANNKRKQTQNPRNIKRIKLSKEILEKNSNLRKTPLNFTTKKEAEQERIQKLLEPYSKDQLIEFLCDAAIEDSILFNKIQNTADKDVSHRKIFVHGLSWDTTRETLVSAFNSFGAIEECKLVVDRNTGKTKGYGFVIFKSRIGAEKALKKPQKKINNRLTSCQLASIGPVAPVQQNQNQNQNQNQKQKQKQKQKLNHQDISLRKIFVSNVNFDADPEKLRNFFGRFGELETGPLGFDTVTGKSRGFALFVYKSEDGANNALKEPYKIFEGHQLHCQKASDYKNNPSSSSSSIQQLPVHQPALSSVASAQNLAIFNQHTSLNPIYSGLVANPNPGFFPGSVNPLMAASLNPNLLQLPQLGLGGYNGFFGGNPLILGMHASSMHHVFHGLQTYPNSQLGHQPSSSRIHEVTGSLTGYPTYLG